MEWRRIMVVKKMKELWSELTGGETRIIFR